MPISGRGKMRRTAHSLAVFTQGGSEWIAGRIYIANLTRALRLLPEEERIKVAQIAPHTSGTIDASESIASKTKWYAFRAADSFTDKLRSAKRGIRYAKWPRSLEAAVLRSGATVGYPVLDSLGRDFPVRWIGWIPDFQHKRLPHFFPEDERERRDKRSEE